MRFVDGQIKIIVSNQISIGVRIGIRIPGLFLVDGLEIRSWSVFFVIDFIAWKKC